MSGVESLSADENILRHRNDGTSPIHQSHFNRNDEALVISARIKPVGGRARTHHIYIDGLGTIKKGDTREYSTNARATPRA